MCVSVHVCKRARERARVVWVRVCERAGVVCARVVCERARV